MVLRSAVLGQGKRGVVLTKDILKEKMYQSAISPAFMSIVLTNVSSGSPFSSMDIFSGAIR